MNSYDKRFEGIGKLKGQVVEFQIDDCIKPVVQKERRLPLGYQERLSKHLQQLKENDVIEGSLDSTVEYK